MPTLFIGGFVFDGHKAPQPGFGVLVENGRVVKVAPAGEFAGFAGETVDTTGGTLMPGLIDCHVHLTMGGEADPGTAQSKLSAAQLTLKTLERAQLTLRSGIVAVRDCGGKDYIELSVRDAIKRGEFTGPVIRASGKIICMTGGHGNRTGRVADGVDEVVKAVREQIHAGADVIKIMATGGVMTPGVDPEDAHYTREEMAAGLAEARRFRKRSASHAQGAEGILNAVLGGVSSIEHGIFMDDECLKAMLERGTFLVPTLAAVLNIVKNADKGIPAWAVEKAQRVFEIHKRNFKRFVDAGGKVAMGTDAGTPFNLHGENAMELKYMVEGGMTPLDALRAGTSNAADLCDLPSHGVIKEGAQADFLLVDGNPVEDISKAADRKNHRAVFSGGLPAGSALPLMAGGLRAAGLPGLSKAAV
ncbi:amidohydrolase family protein [uncultured Ferrovibrio sp.]|mgnify:FL=1|uniref:metal-dependent hydrolase family protein n=1 Tax=uncultured Ferrovibrio sp. TaxID=1576913 RepID=UPI00260A5ABF|nr:amidohydrolase family protein [uncultured Ferrovibrio sp.]